MSPLPYSAVVDEWRQWNAQTNRPLKLDEYAKFMDAREGAPLRQSAYDPNLIQKYSDWVERNLLTTSGMTTPILGPIVPLAEKFLGKEPTRLGPITGEMTEQLRAPINVALEQTPEVWPYGPAGLPQRTREEGEPAPQLPEGALRQVGEGLPRMAVQGAVASTGVGLPLAVVDAYAQAYTPYKDPISGFTSAATFAALPGVMRTGGQLAERGAQRAVFPSMETLVRQSPTEFGRSVVGMAETVADPAVARAMQFANLGGQTVAGTGTIEASKQVESLMREGELAPVTPESVVGSALMTGAMAVPALRNVRGTQTRLAVEEATRARTAQEMRNAAAEAYGRRTQDAHRALLDSVRSGRSPDEALANAKQVYEAARPIERDALALVDRARSEASQGKLPDEAFHRIVAAVQGRFEDTFKADPTGTPWGTIEVATKRGLLPKITKPWIEENFADAVDMMFGDYEGAKANLVNRIYAHLQEATPGALERMRAAPIVPEESRSVDLAAEQEAHDMRYFEALAKLSPYTRTAQVPRTKLVEGVEEQPELMPLDEALWQQDVALSTAVQRAPVGDQENAARNRHAAWKDAIIRMAATYDPTTRKGEFVRRVRMADQRTRETPTLLTLEEMAAPEFLKSLSPKRKYNLPGKSMATTDALELKDAVFGRAEQDEETVPLERGAGERSTRGDRAVMRPTETGRLDAPVPATSTEPVKVEAVPEYLTGADESLRVDPKATGAEEKYDAMTFLLNRLDNEENAALWTKYGGVQLFGKGAKSPGKQELFKDALMASIESLMDDSGKLTVAQKTFYDNWRKGADAQGYQAAELKTWREKRQAYRHALRLYWMKGDVSIKNVLLSMLSDKPQYQQMLTGQGGRSALALEQPSDFPTTPNGTYVSGLRTPLVDTVRLLKGFGQRLGLDDSISTELAVLGGKAVQMFETTAGVGRVTGEDPRVMGSNIANVAYGGPLIALNLDAIRTTNRQEFTAAVRAVQVLAHELAHNYSSHASEFMILDSAYKQQRADAYAKLKAFGESIGHEAADYLLNEILPDVFFPPAFRPETRVSLTGQDFGQEFVSRFMEFAMLSALTKDNPWQHVRQTPRSKFATEHLPEDVQAFLNVAFRDIRNYAGGIAHAMKFSGLKKTEELFDHMLNVADEFLATNVQQQQVYRTVADSMLAKLSAAGSVNWEDPLIIRATNQVEANGLHELVKKDKIAYSLQTVDDGNEARAATLGSNEVQFTPEHIRRLGKTVPTWSRYAGLFFQAMRRFQKSGVPLAEHAMRLVNDLEPSYFRLTRQMHEAFLTVDERGRLKYDPEHPVQRVLQGTDAAALRARKALNTLYLWQNEHGVPVARRIEGKLQPTPEAQEIVRGMLASTPPELQQGVLEGLDALVRSYQRAADIMYASNVENTTHRVAGILMTVDRSLGYREAIARAQTATELSLAWQDAQNQLARASQREPLLVQSLQQQLANTQRQFGEFMMKLSPEEQAVVRDYLLSRDITGTDGKPAKLPGMAQHLLDLRDFFDKRSEWFGSETRPGRFFIVSKMPDGEKHYTSAQTETAARKLATELAQRGHTDFRFIDRNERGEQVYEQPDSVVEDFLKIETNAWKEFQSRWQEKLSPEDIQFLDTLGYVPGEASQKAVQVKGLQRYMQPQKRTPGRELLDAFEVFQDYTGRLSGTIARRSLRNQIDLLLRDPLARQDGQFKQTVNDAVNALMLPIDERFIAARAGMTAYYLGLPNIVSPIVEATQSITSILPYLVSEVGFTKGIDVFRKALVAPAQYMNLGKTLESRRLLQSARDKLETDPSKMTKEEAIAWYYKRAGDEGAFQYGPIYSAVLSRDHQALTQQAFGLGKNTAKSLSERIEDPIYWASQHAMWLYSHTSAYNSRVAMLTALDVMYDRGLRGNDLYLAASAHKNLSTFGGGKANAIGFTNKLVNPTSRSFFAIIETLQRYAYGSLTMYKDFAADMIGNTGLKGRDRVKATEAMMTALAAQLFLAGALGIPGFSIGSAVLNKLSGGKIDAKQKFREFWNTLFRNLGADDELAVTLANYAQNGVVSNALGVDVSNRLATNSILGFNSYDGFNTSELFGVGSSIIEGVIEGTKYAAQGQFVKAGRAVAPPWAKPGIDLAESKSKYGDLALRDQSQRLLIPLTDTESALYAIGLRPQRYRLFRDAQQAMRSAADAHKSTRDTQLDDLAQELRKGNTQAVFDHIKALRMQDPTADSRSAADSIINRAVAMESPLDLLAGQVGDEQRAREIAQSFGNVGPRQSEVQNLAKREFYNAQLGYLAGQPATPRDVERANLIDALIQQQGMTRAEAVRAVGMMGY